MGMVNSDLRFEPDEDRVRSGIWNYDPDEISMLSGIRRQGD